MINPVNVWAKSYEDTWNKVFENSRKDGFNAKKATEEAWSSWVNDNGKGIQCIAPLVAPVTLSGTSSQNSFSPVDFSGAKTPPQCAKVLSDAWKAWASSILWAPPPPAPPFSAITNVVISSPSVTSAYAILLSGLTAEMAKVPKSQAEVPAKYQTLANLFRTATAGLQVDFIGFDLSGPPKPLKLTVPVF